MCVCVLLVPTGATTLLLIRWTSLLWRLRRVWPLMVCNYSRETKHNITNTVVALIGACFFGGCQLVYVGDTNRWDTYKSRRCHHAPLRWTSLSWRLRRVWPLTVCNCSRETKHNITNTMFALIGGHSHSMVPISMGHMFF